MIAVQSQVKQRDVAAANSAFTFIHNLITSLSIVIGGVVLQRGLGTGSLTGSAEGHISAGKNSGIYAAALSKMWIFYTAFCGVMLLSSLWVGKFDVNAKRGGKSESESDDVSTEEVAVVSKDANELSQSLKETEAKSDRNLVIQERWQNFESAFQV